MSCLLASLRFTSGVSPCGARYGCPRRLRALPQSPAFHRAAAEPCFRRSSRSMAQRWPRDGSTARSDRPMQDRGSIGGALVPVAATVAVRAGARRCPAIRASSPRAASIRCAKSGFRSVCGHARRSRQACASSGQHLELLFRGRLSALKTGLSPPIPLLREISPEPVGPRRVSLPTLTARPDAVVVNLVAPVTYSKRFFRRGSRFYRSFRPSTARKIPPRSARLPTSEKPAARIRSATASAWPAPTSTTRAPPRRSRPAACGSSRR